jgi:hypothetical protein
MVRGLLLIDALVSGWQASRVPAAWWGSATIGRSSRMDGGQRPTLRK